MNTVFEILKMAAVLAAAFIVGNWFLSEVKKAKATGAPWYSPYLSAPGLIIIIAVLLPLFFYILHG